MTHGNKTYAKIVVKDYGQWTGKVVRVFYQVFEGDPRKPEEFRFVLEQQARHRKHLDESSGNLSAWDMRQGPFKSADCFRHFVQWWGNTRQDIKGVIFLDTVIRLHCIHPRVPMFIEVEYISHEVDGGHAIASTVEAEMEARQIFDTLIFTE